jgi:hypothetical protein
MRKSTNVDMDIGHGHWTLDIGHCDNTNTNKHQHQHQQTPCTNRYTPRLIPLHAKAYISAKDNVSISLSLSLYASIKSLENLPIFLPWLGLAWLSPLITGLDSFTKWQKLPDSFTKWQKLPDSFSKWQKLPAADYIRSLSTLLYLPPPHWMVQSIAKKLLFPLCLSSRPVFLFRRPCKVKLQHSHSVVLASFTATILFFLLREQLVIHTPFSCHPTHHHAALKNSARSSI